MPINPNEFDGWLDELRAEYQIPGLAVAVVRAGQAIYLKGFGLRDVENGLAVTPDTRFAVCSTTKAFTTMAMSMLVDDGILEWDTPVRSYIPSFKLWDSFATERITPRDLVTHRSGLPRHDNLWRFSSCNRAELFQRLQYLEPSYDLRSVYQYNNLMYMAAGYLVEHLSGMSWEEFVQTRILEPLGMTNSGPGLAQSPENSDYAMPYAQINGKIERIPLFTKTAIGPAGSIISTASDMTRWLLLHLNGGKHEGKELVSKENLVQMHSPQMLIRGIGQSSLAEQIDRFEEIGVGSYGLGWRINTYRGHTLLHHPGDIDGYSAVVSQMPQDDSGVIIFSNLNNSIFPYIVTFGIYDRLLGLAPIPWDQRVKALQSYAVKSSEENASSWEANRKRGTKPSHALEGYTGEYEHPAYGTIIISLSDGRLIANYGGFILPLNHYHYDVFYLSANAENNSIPVSFGGDLLGNISQLSIPLEPAVSDIVFIRKIKSYVEER